MMRFPRYSKEKKMEKKKILMKNKSCNQYIHDFLERDIILSCSRVYKYKEYNSNDVNLPGKGG